MGGPPPRARGDPDDEGEAEPTADGNPANSLLHDEMSFSAGIPECPGRARGRCYPILRILEVSRDVSRADNPYRRSRRRGPRDHPRPRHDCRPRRDRVHRRRHRPAPRGASSTRSSSDAAFRTLTSSKTALAEPRFQRADLSDQDSVVRGPRRRRRRRVLGRSHAAGRVGRLAPRRRAAHADAAPARSRARAKAPGVLRWLFFPAVVRSTGIRQQCLFSSRTRPTRSARTAFSS